MVINQAMHDYSERAGLEAVSLSDIERGPEEAREHAWAWNHWHNPWQPRRSASKESDLQRYITQARELIDLCREADLLLATSIRTLGYVAHHATGIPWLTVSMNPSSYWWPENLQDRMGHLQQTSRPCRLAGFTLGIPSWQAVRTYIGPTWINCNPLHV
jgi:hypothetical protein